MMEENLLLGVGFVIWGLLIFIAGVAVLVYDLLILNRYSITSILFGAFLLVFGGLAIYGAKVLKNIPIHTVQAKVVSKTSVVSGMAGVVNTTYYISFEYNEHRDNVKVDLALYNTVNENDTGLLKYKGANGIYKVISFTRDT